MARTHYLPDEQAHFKWDTSNEPALTVDSGDTVVVWTRNISDNQIGHGLRRERACRPASIGTAPIPSTGRSPSTARCRRHTQDRGPRRPHPGVGMDRGAARLRPPARGLPGRLPPDLRPFKRRRRVLARRHRDPAGPLLRDHGRVPGGRQRPVGGAARQFGGNMDIRQLGRGSTLYLPVEVEQGAVLVRRRPRCPGRRRGLRHRHRGADVRVAALHAREGSLAAGAAVPHARAAVRARGFGAVLRHDGRERRPLRRRSGRRAGDDRPHRHDVQPRPRGRVRALQPRRRPEDLRDRRRRSYIVSALLPETVFTG